MSFAANWASATTTTTGTGALTIAAIAGYPSPWDVVGSQPMHYDLIDDATGAPIEAGIGYCSSATVFVRQQVLATMVGGVYNAAPAGPASLPAGTCRLICGGFEGTTMLGGISGTDASLGSTRFLHGAQIVGNPGANATVSANVVHACPFRLDMRAVTSGVGLQVVTAGAAGSTARAAIARVGPDGRAGNIIAESSATSVATTGNKVMSWPSNVVLPGGWYLIYVAASAAFAVRGINTQGPLGQTTFWGISGGDPAGRITGATKALTYSATGPLFGGVTSTGWSFIVDWSGSFPPLPTLALVA